MQIGTAITLARDGHPVLSAPIGTSAYCTAQICKTITSESIQRHLHLLSTFDHRHQRTKLALYCCNSSIVYLLSALPLEVVLPELPYLDQLFQLEGQFKDSAVHNLSWLASKLGPPVSSQDPARIVLPYIQAAFNAAKDALSRDHDWMQ